MSEVFLLILQQLYRPLECKSGCDKTDDLIEAHRNVDHTPNATLSILLEDSTNLFPFGEVALVRIDLCACAFESCRVLWKLAFGELGNATK